MLKLYNTLTKKKQTFKPLKDKKVGMYVCGPTVYDYAHIGNWKSYITADILQRYLEYSGYQVKMVKNITDVGHLTQDDLDQADSGEDKIAKAAIEKQKTPKQIARFYEDYYKKTEKKLNILPAEIYPRATEHIQEMIKMIQKLIKNKHAYSKNGNVFYNVTSFSKYGKLSGNKLEDLKTESRLEKHPDKKNIWDFALWIKAPQGHLMQWHSPWSNGYPGWHIECSAMSLKYLGKTFDIHTGGEDHIFPHHEAEIAQSEGALKKKFVNFWIHTRHIMIEGQKMSKSKNNFHTLEDIILKDFSAMDLRLALMSAHYRSRMNFTWEGMAQAQKNRKKINEFINKIKKIALEKLKDEDSQNLSLKVKGLNLSDYQKKFEESLDDDLNLPLALSIFYNFITQANKLLSQNQISIQSAKEIFSFWKKINLVLGILIEEEKEENIPQTVQKLADERELARVEKDYKKADQLRSQIEDAGYWIEDTEEGYVIKNR